MTHKQLGNDSCHFDGRYQHYKLEKKTPVPAKDLSEWAEWMESADRRVAETSFAWGRVSTVFLGLNHNYSLDPNDPPLLFETMIFGGGSEDNCYRYCTWE